MLASWNEVYIYRLCRSSGYLMHQPGVSDLKLRFSASFWMKLLILDWQRTRQQVVQQKFTLRVKTRFNPFRDSAGCTIAMRWRRRLSSS